jgi:hypothetical protein
MKDTAQREDTHATMGHGHRRLCSEATNVSKSIGDLRLGFVRLKPRVRLGPATGQARQTIRLMMRPFREQRPQRSRFEERTGPSGRDMQKPTLRKPTLQKPVGQPHDQSRMNSSMPTSINRTRMQRSAGGTPRPILLYSYTPATPSIAGYACRATAPRPRRAP